MGSSAVVNTAIGLVFVFLVVSLAATALVEYLSKLMDKRGEYLLRGLREMLDVPPSAPSGDGTVDPAVVGESAGLLGTRTRRNRGRTRGLLQELSEHGRELGTVLLDPAVVEVRPKAALSDLVLAHPVVASLHRPLTPGSLPQCVPVDALPGVEVTRRVQGPSDQAPAGTQPRAASASSALAPTSRRTRAAQPVRHPLLHPLRQRRARQGQMRLASYLSSRTFAVALLDLLVPNAKGRSTTLDQVRTSLGKLPDGTPGRDALLVLVRQAEGDLTSFRVGVERWYDEQMSRVSGWYKRWAQFRLFLAGAVLAALFNVNSITVAQTLYRDEPVRTAAVAAAVDAAACPMDASGDACRDAQTRVLRDLPLPVGWDLAAARGLCETRQGEDCAHHPVSAARFLLDEVRSTGAGSVALTLVGWFITAAAVSMGAPWWFDALGKLGSLRTAGRRPEQSTPAAA